LAKSTPATVACRANDRRAIVSLAAQRNFRVDCRKIMMSEWYQNTLPQTKLSGSKSTEILFQVALSRPRFFLVNRARRPSAYTSKINNLHVKQSDRNCLKSGDTGRT
jgi:hypothetical protein